jgi:hypothetical protein
MCHPEEVFREMSAMSFQLAFEVSQKVTLKHTQVKPEISRDEVFKNGASLYIQELSGKKYANGKINKRLSGKC